MDALERRCKPGGKYFRKRHMIDVLNTRRHARARTHTQADADLSTRLGWLIDMGMALSYLHTRFKSVFRELTPSNIFVGCTDTCGTKNTDTGALAGTMAKLVDLSSSAYIAHYGKRKDNNIVRYWAEKYPSPACPTRRKAYASAWTKLFDAIKATDYSAPEASATTDGNKKRYGPAGDIFSLGKLINTLVNKDKSAPQSIQDLIGICTNANPSERPCIGHIVSKLNDIRSTLKSN